MTIFMLTLIFANTAPALQRCRRCVRDFIRWPARPEGSNNSIKLGISTVFIPLENESAGHEHGKLGAHHG